MPPIPSSTFPQSASPFFNPHLLEDILEMSEHDQAARKKVVEALNGNLNAKIPEEITDEIQRFDMIHNLLIKKILAEYGWPGYSLVGKKGSDAFWLLVQHQDKDINLQLDCLKLLKDAVKNKEAAAENFAYLTDRIKKNQGLPQVYGSQTVIENGELKLYPVEHPEHLDQRRQEYNLSTAEEYLQYCTNCYNLSQVSAEK